MTAKTKRDRAAGRRHRHTAIQAIIDNNDQVRADIDSLDNSIACLQDENCNLGSRLDHWYTILDEKNTHTRQNVAYTMRCVVENERKIAEIEPALAILQESSKEHQETSYVNKVHGRQIALNQELNLLQAEMGDTNRRIFQLAWISVGLWAIAALTIFILLII